MVISRDELNILCSIHALENSEVMEENEKVLYNLQDILLSEEKQKQSVWWDTFYMYG